MYQCKHYLFATLLFLSFLSCKKEEITEPTTSGTEPTETPFEKKEVLFKGVSFEGPSSPIESDAYDPIVSINGNSISIIPFGFIYSNDSIVNYNSSFQWWGEKDEGVIALINFAQEKNLKVMVKPQIWLLNGQFTGNFELTTETQWQALENSYADYIIHFAQIADSLNCELFSIGTEFRRFVEVRPNFWDHLIDTVRLEFSGQLTYAENWDAFHNFPHWEKLDFIGIDAYFPVSDLQTPTEQDCKNGWTNHLALIESVQAQSNKPVLFTEYGYRSMDYCGQEPWDTSDGTPVNLTAQQNAYLGLYKTFWDQEWFEGGFTWKWFGDHQNAGGISDNRFTPQNKPAEQTLQAMYE